MDVVLVHGAWHGAWCWERVAERLRGAGHAVHAPELPMRGDGIDLSAHVATVVAAIERERLARFVLCGHSYGGAVASAVADRMPERIVSLVYVDAFVPEEDQALVDLVLPQLRERFAAAAAASGGTVPPIPAASFGVNEADRALVDARCVPQPYATFTEPLRLRGGLRDVARRVYLRAGGYPNAVFERYYERFRDDPAWETATLPCGHDVMLDLPAELAALLDREARAA